MNTISKWLTERTLLWERVVRGQSSKRKFLWRGIALLAFAGQVIANPTPKFAYVADYQSANISAFTIDSTSGALTPVAGSPFATGAGPISVTVDPSGKFVYVVNVCTPSCTSGISAYTIDGTSGALTPVAGSPFAAGVYPFSVTVDPSGKFIYVANNCASFASCGSPGNVSAFTIDSTSGALTPVAGSPFPAGVDPVSVTVDPSGKFVYVANVCGSSYASECPDLLSANVSAYTIDGTSGALTPVAGSPFAAGEHTVSVTVDPSGKFVYALNECGSKACSAGSVGSVSAFAIDGTSGALTPVAGSPFTAGVDPLSVTVDPLGKFVYVANTCSSTACSAGSISAYTIDNTNGALTPVAGSPFAAVVDAWSVMVDPSGNFVYVANFCGNTPACTLGSVSAFTIDGTSGALTPVAGSPFAAAGQGSISVAVAGQAYVPLVLSCPAASAQVGAPYSSALTAAGGIPPDTFSIFTGSLPGGLTLNASTGAITGTPTTAGPFSFTAKVVDSSGLATGTVTSNCAITVSPPPVSQELTALLKEVTGVGPGTSLADKVVQAQAYYAVSNTQATCAVLTGFVNEVRAQNGKMISQQLDAKLIADAQSIEAAIGCQ